MNICNHSILYADRLGTRNRAPEGRLFISLRTGNFGGNIITGSKYYSSLVSEASINQALPFLTEDWMWNTTA